ncbi:MAG: DUF4404 family protein [Chitinivibrionales bacterium]|nr:DUF4404 family protein [Chitinivibrionales bacterium]
MQKDKLTQDLKDLRKELRQVQSQDPATRQKLATLEKRADESLQDASLNTQDEYRHLARDLQDALLHLETTHPRLTVIINRLVYTLNNLGI